MKMQKKLDKCRPYLVRLQKVFNVIEAALYNIFSIGKDTFRKG